MGRSLHGGGSPRVEGALTDRLRELARRIEQLVQDVLDAVTPVSEPEPVLVPVPVRARPQPPVPPAR